MGLFIGDNAPSKIFIGDSEVSKVFVGDTKVRPTSRLPSEYQEVEYIESDGAQYIDTGISANQYLSFEADFQPIQITNNRFFFGARNGSSSQRFALIVYQGNFHMMIGSQSTFNTTASTDRHKCSVFMNNGTYTATLDGITYTNYVGTSVFTSKNFSLFKVYWNNDGAIPHKLYSFKLYTGNSNLVRNFVPCYRIADTEIGLYDLVNSVFYTNSGSGTFTKGSDV